jgi:acetyl esterase/lipase
MSSSARALKGVSDAFTPGFPPLLLLHGLNDSMIDPAAARAFAARSDAKGRVTLITYTGLGHSFGRASSPENDALLPISDAPLDDMARWLRKTMGK